MHELPLIDRARLHGDSVAMRCAEAEFTYQELLARSAAIAADLLADDSDLHEARVGFLVPAGFEYVATQWGIWRAGGVAVPLSLSATEPELEHTLVDSQPVRVVTTRVAADRVISVCERLGLPVVLLDDVAKVGAARLPDIDTRRRAMILYTSGTTSKPKGVVTTHANIQAQTQSLVEAWRWQATDRIPLFLPLHHIHGIVPM